MAITPVLPGAADIWANIVRSALEREINVPVDELLLVRDQSGRRFRPLGPPPGTSARLGAVLILLYPHGPDLRMPLTIRSEHLPNHRGEVSLPGGATDPEDIGPSATALRECHEEIGVVPHGLEIWGELSPIYIAPSNFQITPVVAYSSTEPTLIVNADEVSGIITVTLRELLDPATVVIERRTMRGIEVDVPYFAIANQKVWGATAMVLSDFVARIRHVLRSETSR